MAATPAIPGLFFCFAATVLLIFVCISSPTWEKISFLDVGAGAGQIHYGVFGHTGTGTHIGYDFVDEGRANVNTVVVRNLTKTLILHPIAAGLAGLAVLFGICGASYHRAGTVIMTLCASLATIITFIAWVIDMVVFGIARNRYRSAGIPAQYGNANWLTLGAVIALILGFCVGVCGVFGRYRRRTTTATY